MRRDENAKYYFYQRENGKTGKLQRRQASLQVEQLEMPGNL
jgi:hypothetical protein